MKCYRIVLLVIVASLLGCTVKGKEVIVKWKIAEEVSLKVLEKEINRISKQ